MPLNSPIMRHHPPLLRSHLATTMATTIISSLLLLLLSTSTHAADGDWNIISYMNTFLHRPVANLAATGNLGTALNTYCEGWRINVEVNNIRGFTSVPEECVEYVGKYMTSPQYKIDVQRAAEESASYLTREFVLGRDGKDAWVFDVDDTLLSTLPYYEATSYGECCRPRNETTLESWMRKGRAPAVEHMVALFNSIRWRGLKIILLSSRAESLRGATEENLIRAGYGWWSELILRCPEDYGHGGVEEYMREKRKDMIRRGYRLWGVMGSQWNGLVGNPTAKRTFKLPNPMYYVS